MMRCTTKSDYRFNQPERKLTNTLFTPICECDYEHHVFQWCWWCVCVCSCLLCSRSNGLRVAFQCVASSHLRLSNNYGHSIIFIVVILNLPCHINFLLVCFVWDIYWMNNIDGMDYICFVLYSLSLICCSFLHSLEWPGTIHRCWSLYVIFCFCCVSIRMYRGFEFVS